MSWIVFINWHKLELSGSRNINWEVVTIILASGHAWEDIFLIVGWCGRGQPTLYFPYQVVLGKEAEKSRDRMPVSIFLHIICSKFPPPGSCFKLLPWLPSIIDYDMKVKAKQTFSFPKLLLISVLEQQQKSKLKHSHMLRISLFKNQM